MKIRNSVVINDLGDSYTAYDLSNSTMHTINESGYLVLKMIKKGMNKGEIVNYFSEYFELTRDQARLDVEGFLKILKSKKIIE